MVAPRATPLVIRPRSAVLRRQGPSSSPDSSSTTPASTASNPASTTSSSSTLPTSSSTILSSSSSSSASSTVASSSSSVVSSSSTSQSSSSASSSASSSSSTSSTPTSSTVSSIVTSSDGQVSTIFTTVPAASATQTKASGTGSKSFFQNKGAVAGVFTVAGLAVLVILFLIITTFIRRRRAQKFDREVTEAAAQAAATSRGVNPYEDDDDDPLPGANHRFNNVPASGGEYWPDDGKEALGYGAAAGAGYGAAAAYHDHPQHHDQYSGGPTAEAYSMSDLGRSNTVFSGSTGTHNRNPSAEPGMAGLGAGHVDDGLRYRGGQGPGGQNGPYYDNVPGGLGGYYGPSGGRNPEGGYDIARFYSPRPPEQQQQYLSAGPQHEGAGYMPNPHSPGLQNPHQAPNAPVNGNRASGASAYGGYEDGDPFAAQSSAGHGDKSPSPGPGTNPKLSPGRLSADEPISTAFNHPAGSEESGDWNRDSTGMALGGDEDEHDWRNAPRGALRVANE